MKIVSNCGSIDNGKYILKKLLNEIDKLKTYNIVIGDWSSGRTIEYNGIIKDDIISIIGTTIKELP